MKEALFWIIAALLCAAAAHLGFLLLLPNLELTQMEKQIDDTLHKFDVSTLSQQSAVNLLGDSSLGFANAACRFDLSHTEMFEVKAAIPNSFWMMLIYASNGDLVQTFSDRQVGSKQLTINIKDANAPDTSDADNADKNIETGEPNAAYRRIILKSPTPSGLVVLSAAVNDPALRADIEYTLLKSRCKPLSGTFQQ